jgi:hypothetical protein
VAAYLKTKIPATVRDDLEVLLLFFICLFEQLAGSITVIEVPGGQPVRAVEGAAFVAQDGYSYFGVRMRIRVAPDWKSNGLPFWLSSVNSLAANVAIPTVFGGAGM